MKARSSQLQNAGLALGARLAGGVAAAQATNKISGTSIGSSQVDLGGVALGGLLWATSKDWGTFGMWLALISGADYATNIIPSTLTQAAPQLTGQIV